MAAVPMKPEYGPTLGRLLAPRWHALPAAARRAAMAGGLLLAIGVVALVLALLDASYSPGGRVPFSFRYRSLYRTAADPGGFVRIVQRAGDGSVRYSLGVDPIALPAYAGEWTGAIPIYASRYIDRQR